MGNIFKGLAASGCWGCFDEFNRLVPEVLSVCTVQFKAVCDAVKGRAKRFILQGDEINLDIQVGILFIKHTETTSNRPLQIISK